MERKLIAAAVSSALALPMAAQAVEFSVSGHINRAIISVDGGGASGKPDAHDGDVQHVDANSSETRFRFTGSEELENGMTAGVQLELGRPGNWRTRHANVSLSTAGGKITIGQASEATDGVAHADLGGPAWLGGATNWCSYAGGGPACPSNDGNRNPVLRYDTPAIGPATISVSTGNNDFFDVKLSIAGSFGDAGYDLRIGHQAEYEADVAAVDAENKTVTGKMLKGALMGADHATITEHMADTGTTIVGLDTAATSSPDAIADIADADVFHKHTPGTAATTKDVGDITTASAAVGFGQGTSVAFAWSQENTGSQVEYTYMKLDHSYGDGSVGVYYKTGEYGAGMKKGVDGSLWGIGLGHSLGGGAHAYAGYRQISEDGMKDIDLLLAGMRVTFN